MERIVLHASPRHLRRKLALNLAVPAIGVALGCISQERADPLGQVRPLIL